jgi:DNA-binding MarR family transcriptional regulator
MSSERPAFEHGTGFLLSRLGTLAERGWSALLATHDLTPTQYVLLAILSGHETLGQGRLARRAGVDSRNLVAVLDALQHRGLVVRTVDPTDTRRRDLSLSPTGDALMQALAASAATGRDEFLGALNLDERRQLNTLLQRVYDAHTDRA